MTELQQRVERAYSQIALAPATDPPFPIGRSLAEGLGYPATWLDTLPRCAVDAFCGVARVSLLADITAQDLVLDLGCGAGMDSLIAAQRGAKVVAADFSLAMLERGRQAAHQAGLDSQITFLHGPAQHLPLREGSVDVALVNGLFNLNPFREELFAELARVVRPGGRVFAAELILSQPLPARALTAANWFT